MERPSADAVLMVDEVLTFVRESVRETEINEEEQRLHSPVMADERAALRVHDEGARKPGNWCHNDY
jgi:hypothetical protein